MRFFLHGREHNEIHRHTEHGDEANTPVKREKAEHEDDRVDKPAHHIDKHHRPLCLDHFEHGSGDASEGTEAFVVKVSHRHTLELVANGNTPICHHEIACMGLLKLSEAVRDSAPCGAHEDQRQRDPDSAVCCVMVS